MGIFVGTKGVRVREVGGGEIRWWINMFRGYVWDGQE